MSLKLEDLPVEVLERILGYDDLSFDVLELLKIGSRLLISKLREGGVKRLTLIHTDERIQLRWPKGLRDLKLEELHVSSVSPLLASIETRNELKKLSGNLKVLSLDFMEAEKVLFGPFKLSLTLPPTTASNDESRPSKVPKLVDTADADLPHEELWNLDLTWPKLEELCVFDRLEDPNKLLQLTSEIFALLPRSLLKFDLEPYLYKLDASHLATLLPPKLERLCLHNEITGDGICHIPASITDIGSSLQDAAHKMLVKDPGLLPNLKVFPMGLDAHEHWFSLDWIFSTQGQWPQAIEELALNYTSAESIFDDKRPLPRLLKRLELIFSRSPYDITAVWLMRAVPRSLVDLRVGAINWTGIKSTIWPSTLRTLFLTDRKFGPQHFHQLPRSITCLSTKMALDGEEEQFYVFDNSALCELGRSCLSGLDKDLWLKLKAQLVKDTLKLTGSDSNAVALIEAIENGRHFGLPLGLLELSMGVHAYFSKYTLVVPPQLRQLDLPGAVVDRPNFLELLPPTLTHLSTSFPQYYKKDNVSDPSNTPLAQLASLTHLTIRAEDEPQAALALQCVPRNLKTLVFEDDKRAALVTRAHLANLPPTLTWLEIVANCHHAQNWVQLLPRSLLRLMSPLTLSGAEFKLLPPNMVTAYVSLKEITLSDFWTLPRSLFQFRRWFTCKPSSDDSEDEEPSVEFDEPLPHGDEAAPFLSEEDAEFLLNKYLSFRLMFKYHTLEEVEKALEEHRSGNVHI